MTTSQAQPSDYLKLLGTNTTRRTPCPKCKTRATIHPASNAYLPASHIRREYAGVAWRCYACQDEGFIRNQTLKRLRKLITRHEHVDIVLADNDEFEKAFTLAFKPKQMS